MRNSAKRLPRAIDGARWPAIVFFYAATTRVGLLVMATITIWATINERTAPSKIHAFHVISVLAIIDIVFIALLIKRKAFGYWYGIMTTWLCLFLIVMVSIYQSRFALASPHGFNFFLCFIVEAVTGSFPATYRWFARFDRSSVVETPYQTEIAASLTPLSAGDYAAATGMAKEENVATPRQWILFFLSVFITMFLLFVVWNHAKRGSVFWHGHTYHLKIDPKQFWLHIATEFGQFLACCAWTYSNWKRIRRG